MKRSFRITILFATVAMLASCADKKTESYRDREQKSFDEWMAMYVENTPEQPLERLDNGTYVQWLRPPRANNDRFAPGDWLEINYTGTRMPDKNYSDGRGRVFMTRDSMVAKQENTFSPYAHYSPRLIHFVSQGGLPQGMYEAVDAIRGRLNIGDKIRIFIPASLATSLQVFHTTNGYGGSYEASSGVAMIIDTLEIVNVIESSKMTIKNGYAKPRKKTMFAEHELELVKDYAFNKWNMTESDTMIYGFYYDLVETGVFEEEENGTTADTKPEKIGKDGTAKIWYVGKFLDDFVFDTNIDSIGRRTRRDTTSYDTLKLSLSSSSFIQAFSELVDTMYYNSHFKMVFPSTYGYGTTGEINDAPSTIIQWYTPLVFEVWVAPKAKTKEEEK